MKLDSFWSLIRKHESVCLCICASAPSPVWHYVGQRSYSGRKYSFGLVVIQAKLQQQKHIQTLSYKHT